MSRTTDIQHLLDEDGMIANLTPEAYVFALFLTEIIESTTENYGIPLAFANTQCQNVNNGAPCLGEIESWVYAEDHRIGWECVDCAETGAISNWEGTRWDRRDPVRH